MSLDELKTALGTLGAQPAVSLLVALEEHIRAVTTERDTARAEVARLGDVEQQRRAKQAEREATLAAQIEAATAEATEARNEIERLGEENRKLRDKIEQLDTHPDVRAAKRARLAEQAAAIYRQMQALAEPEAPAETVRAE
jgi:septal ring factor EnvC (AmiA/AmiB activator)